jgi:hypothetical protein
MRARPEDDHLSVRLRVLALHPFEPFVAADDQVEVPVLSVGDRNLLTPSDEVRGDHDFREVALGLEGCD